MISNVVHILQHICLLQSSQRLVTGISGGPDSTCLLDLLNQAGYEVIVAHLNHELRPEADDEEARLRDYASRLGIEFVSHKVDVRAYSVSNRTSLEEAARDARYRFLFDVAARTGSAAVAVGHNADDQVETVLMHLLRGSGLSGLRGMEPCLLPNPWSAEIPLVRPLLGVRRTEIMEYLAVRGLPYETDESNADTSYYRNRLRHELIPFLESYNPEISQSILRMAELLRGEHSVVEAAVDAASRLCNFQTGDGYVRMSAKAFGEQLLAIRRSLLRRAIGCLKPGLRDVDFSMIERAIGFLDACRTGSRELGSGVHVVLDPVEFYITTDLARLPLDAWPQVQPGAAAELNIPGELRLSNGWKITAWLEPAGAKINDSSNENLDEHVARVDLDRLSLPLAVRARQMGDRMQVLGMGGSRVKLSDLMINARVPARARHAWPVVLSGGEVVWVPGLRVSEQHRVTARTEYVAALVMSKD
jgi:tRNA(Ile)-lysidine synthase